jgi:NAD(P)-dependent dehydrogenase (short-subunit alcohol dehydrogenase family)
LNNKVFSDLFDISDRNIIITGSSGMLGSQYADVVSKYGGNVILVDIIKNKNLELELKKKYDTKIKSYKVDISKENQVKKLKKLILDDFKRIDGLVNNAAYTNVSAIKDSTEMHSGLESFPSSLWQQMINVNLTSVFYCCREFGTEMAKQNKGTIVNIGSTYGLVGADQRIYGNNKINSPVSYAATKGAIINLTRYLAAYWHGKNIRVNTLTPGGVEDKRYQKPTFIKNYSRKTILGRMAKNFEYNGAIIFLLSDASSYMTGSNLIIDGGWTAW